MGMIAAAARELVAAGVTGDALVTAIDRIEEAGRPIRSAAAERMIAYRKRRREEEDASRVTHGDGSGFPDKEIPPTPPKEINPSPSLRSDSLSARGEIAVEFSQTFWPEYPHKVGKPAADRAFHAARKRADLDRIMAGLARYREAKPPDRDWLNPATFLNQDRFDDQPASPPATNANRPHDTIFGALAEVVADSAGLGFGEACPDERVHDFPGPAPAIADHRDELEIPTFLRREAH